MSDACGADKGNGASRQARLDPTTGPNEVSGPRGGSASDAQELLVVAVCAGARCRALRELHDPSASEAGPAGAKLREAVRGRSGAVLVSTECLGPCHRACVVAVGTGVAGDGGRLLWHGRPVGLGLVELADRATELADWVGGAAPDLAGLPQQLWGIGAA